MVRVVFSYLVVILIAMQSVMAIADTHNSHEKSHHSSEHYSIDSETSNSNHSEVDNHPDCHQSHCHHGSLVYIDLPTSLNLAMLDNQHVSPHLFDFSSLKIRSEPEVI